MDRKGNPMYNCARMRYVRQKDGTYLLDKYDIIGDDEFEEEAQDMTRNEEREEWLLKLERDRKKQGLPSLSMEELFRQKPPS